MCRPWQEANLNSLAIQHIFIPTELTQFLMAHAILNKPHAHRGDGTALDNGIWSLHQVLWESAPFASLQSLFTLINIRSIRGTQFYIRDNKNICLQKIWKENMYGGPRQHNWLRHYFTSWKVAGSRPKKENVFFPTLSNPSSRSRPWGLLSLLTVINTRNRKLTFLGSKAATGA
jgi:hypothetical protein